MAKKQSGLGKGLGALMLENSVDEMVATNTLPLNEIMPNKEQPRKTFDEGALQELADSIVQHGVLQPLLVRPLASGGYQLVAGERRWRASRMAGLKEVPVVEKNFPMWKQWKLQLLKTCKGKTLTRLKKQRGCRHLLTVAVSRRRKLPHRWANPARQLQMHCDFLNYRLKCVK